MKISRARLTSAQPTPLAPPAPPPYVHALLGRLVAEGLARGPGEALERYALRLRAEGSSRAAALVGRYAALRYGQRGDAVQLEGDVRRWLREAPGATP